jgi:hypothetical protein
MPGMPMTQRNERIRRQEKGAFGVVIVEDVDGYGWMKI